MTKLLDLNKVLNTIDDIYGATDDWLIRHDAILGLPGGIGDTLKKQYDIYPSLQHSRKSELEEFIQIIKQTLKTETKAKE